MSAGRALAGEGRCWPLTAALFQSGLGAADRLADAKAGTNAADAQSFVVGAAKPNDKRKKRQRDDE